MTMPCSKDGITIVTMALSQRQLDDETVGRIVRTAESLDRKEMLATIYFMASYLNGLADFMPGIAQELIRRTALLSATLEGSDEG